MGPQLLTLKRTPLRIFNWTRFGTLRCSELFFVCRQTKLCCGCFGLRAARDVASVIVSRFSPNHENASMDEPRHAAAEAGKKTKDAAEMFGLHARTVGKLVDKSGTRPEGVERKRTGGQNKGKDRRLQQQVGSQNHGESKGQCQETCSGCSGASQDSLEVPEGAGLQVLCPASGPAGQSCAEKDGAGEVPEAVEHHRGHLLHRREDMHSG